MPTHCGASSWRCDRAPRHRSDSTRVIPSSPLRSPTRWHDEDKSSRGDPLQTLDAPGKRLRSVLPSGGSACFDLLDVVPPVLDAACDRSGGGPSLRGRPGGSCTRSRVKNSVGALCKHVVLRPRPRWRPASRPALRRVSLGDRVAREARPVGCCRLHVELSSDAALDACRKSSWGRPPRLPQWQAERQRLLNPHSTERFPRSGGRASARFAGRSPPQQPESCPPA